MYTLSEIQNWLFVDVETVSEARTLADLTAANPGKGRLWQHRCEYLRRRYAECANMTDTELYVEKAGLHPEFAKIMCVCLGIYKGDGAAQVIGYAGDDEKELLGRALSTIGKFKSNVYDRSKTASAMLCGHNIKRFDVPFLCKRALSHKLELPELLQVQGKKPWEMSFVDTAEVWSFGAWQESFASLELMANVLGLQSPKEDFHGDMVQRKYWEEGATEQIKHYCQNDVIATMNIVLDWSGLPVVPFETAIRA